MEYDKPVDVAPLPDVGDVILCQDYAHAHRDGMLDPKEFTKYEKNLVKWGTILIYARKNERN